MAIICKFYASICQLLHYKRFLFFNRVRFVREFTPLSETARLPRKDRVAKRAPDTIIENGIALDPSYVHTMLRYTPAASIFSVEGRQEDAEEFLSCLLNGINDEMLDVRFFIYYIIKV